MRIRCTTISSSDCLITPSEEPQAVPCSLPSFCTERATLTDIAEADPVKNFGQAFLKACGYPKGKALGRSSQRAKLPNVHKRPKG
ncbi:MAG: hypothetical protein E7668_03010 [Ruminococcaceae bacterium]|nr:hypothetical protein [Oscillospiraceae bacterium]